MSQIGRIKLKDISKLIQEESTAKNQQHADTALPGHGGSADEDHTTTSMVAAKIKHTPPAEPVKPKPRVRRQKPKTTEAVASAEDAVTPGKSTVRRNARTTLKKELAANQKKIDNFFKSCSKTYKIEPDKINVTAVKVKKSERKNPNATTVKKSKAPQRKTRGRKRLFEDTSNESDTDLSMPSRTKSAGKSTSNKPNTRLTAKKKAKELSAAKALDPVELIDLCTDSELDFDMETSRPNKSMVVEKENTASNQNQRNETDDTSAPPMVSIPRETSVSATASAPQLTSGTSEETVGLKTRLRKQRICPDYKVVDGTTFAVDAFNFGPIEGVTHYFLTHFHADHYVGLTRKFSMPLYTSTLTARLLRSFIPIDEKYLYELELNVAVVIEDVEVTAIDANHCPGAVMLVFKLLSGKCILHTGDFRASPAMESEPIFWNNDIDTIYLDTTYLSNKYVFRTQEESIEHATRIFETVKEKHKNKRLLVVCGSYLIGKEKFWTHLAREFNLKVWTEDNRRKALTAMNLYLDLLVDDPLQASMHVIPIGKVGYLTLETYYEQFRAHFDVLVAFRPSGWEKRSRPSYGNKINVIGIEYSEHSGYNELQRFVTYLKPKTVISTVPISGGDMTRTAFVPTKWYQYDKLSSMKRNFQPSITSYLPLQKAIANKKESNPLLNKTSVYENLMLVSPNTVVNDSGRRLHLYRHGEEQPASEAIDVSTFTPYLRDADLVAYGLDSEVSEYQDIFRNGHIREREESARSSDIKPVVSGLDALDDWMP